MIIRLYVGELYLAISRAELGKENKAEIMRNQRQDQGTVWLAKNDVCLGGLVLISLHSRLLQMYCNHCCWVFFCMNQFTVFDLYEISNATVLVSVQLVFKDIILHKIVYSLFYVKGGNFNVTCLKNCLLWKITL